MTITEGAPRARGKGAGRRENLAAALSAIYERGALSRTELIRDLGLGRTTVFELLAQLSASGLVVDGDSISRGGSGRPSRFVAASPTLGAYVVNPEIDVLTVGIATMDGALDTLARRWTPLPPEPTARAARVMLDELSARRNNPPRIVGIAVGVPGQVAADSQRVLAAPSLDWRDTDVGATFGAEFDLPSLIDNNARLVTSSELRRGAGVGVADVVYVFGGAGGIGGGIVSGGTLLTGASGVAAEIGHIRIATPDGAVGTLESLVTLADLGAALSVRELDDDALEAALAHSRGPNADIVIARQLSALGVGIGNLVNLIGPRLVLLGGFLGVLYRRAPRVFDAALRSVALPVTLEGLTIGTSSQTSKKVLLGGADRMFRRVAADPLGTLAVLEAHARRREEHNDGHS